VLDAVVVEPSLAEVAVPELSRRFIVGRSGSSAGVVVLLVVELVVEPVLAGVLDAVVDVPELAVSGLRRFMVGRSESSLVAVLVVPAVVVVSGLLLVWGVEDVVEDVEDLLWSLPAEEVVSPLVFVTRCGRFGSADEVVMVERVFEGFSAWAVFLGAASGLTLP
jgi:hypothetical protein